MIKVTEETIKSVRVVNSLGKFVWLPKSQIRLDDNNQNVLASRKWLIEENHLVEVETDDTIGIKVEIINKEEIIVHFADKEYKRKLYPYKKFGILAFNFKVGMFTIPNKKSDLTKYFTNENGLKCIGFYDGSSFSKKMDEFLSSGVLKVEDEDEEDDWGDTQDVVEEEKWEPEVVEHKEYETIKSCIEANIPVYLYGPAGSGKNYTLQNIALDLGLEFYFTNSVQQEFKITGFIDAGGDYHETEFYKAFTNGGLFFLDEMDASIPEVLVLLNAAIANGYFEFPNGKVFANKNFRVVAAGNTIGSGADELYTGRLVLDQATLDRFVAIEFDYDENIELNLAKGDKELVEFIRELRRKAKETGVRTTFSYRCIISIVKLESIMDLVKIFKIAVFKGMDIDTINTLKNKYSSNKYFKVMDKMVA